jgi:hypothetical protein
VTKRLALQVELTAAGSQEANDLALRKNMQRIAREEIRHVEQAGELVAALERLWTEIASLRAERARWRKYMPSNCAKRARFFNPGGAKKAGLSEAAPVPLPDLRHPLRLRQPRPSSLLEPFASHVILTKGRTKSPEDLADLPRSRVTR